MVHSKPPFWPPVFLGANYYSERNREEVNTQQKIGISAVSYPKTLKVINSWIKIFVFFFQNRQFVFAPKIQYKLTAERSEAASSGLQFPHWCVYCTKSEPIFKIGNVPRAERVVALN